MILIKNIILSIDKTIHLVEKGDFIAKKGELTALVGRSGVGKTTFLNSIIFKQDSLKCDQYSIDGQDIHSSEDLISEVVYLQQENKFFNDMTMGDNLKIHQAILNENYQLNLDDSNLALSEKFPKHLSGGEINRFEFEKIKIGKPKLILLDETFSSLDQEVKLYYIQYLKDKVKHDNCYAIIIIHDDDLLPYFDSIYKIEDKELINIKASQSIDKDVQWEKKQPNSKLAFLFYFKKLLGNKWNWLFISILISCLTTCFLVSLRMLTWVDRFYQDSISMLDSSELLVQRVTNSNIDEYVKIDVLDWSFPLEENKIKELETLPNINSIYPRYQFYAKEGSIYANERNLDPYCTKLFNDNGIYLSSAMFEKLDIHDGKAEMTISIPVAQINHIAKEEDQLEYRETKYIERKVEVTIRGVLDNNFNNLTSSEFAYMDSEEMIALVGTSQENYQLIGQEERYIPNLFVVKLKDGESTQFFSQSLFELNQELVVTSHREILENIRDFKSAYNRNLGTRVILITGVLIIITLVAIHYAKMRANYKERDLFKSYCIDKKNINKIIFTKIFINSLLNGILSYVISIFMINWLISQKLLTSTQTISLNYFAIVIICFSFSLLSHMIIKE